MPNNKQRSVRRDQFASGASLGPQTKMMINGVEGMYGATRRCHGPLEHDVNTGGIGGMRGGGITRQYRKICR